MAYISPFDQAKALQQQVGVILSAIDVDVLPATERELIAELRRLMVDARLDIRDYDYAETRAEQLVHAKQARERLEQFQKTILSASEYNIFSAIDVAQLSAVTQQIAAQLT